MATKACFLTFKLRKSVELNSGKDLVDCHDFPSFLSFCSPGLCVDVYEGGSGKAYWDSVFERDNT